MKLETVTGRMIDLNDPNPKDIDIEDIAWGLSRIPRFCGHTITILPYTVAQHSVFVADEVKNFEYTEEEQNELTCLRGSNFIRLELKALLHDAAETYMGDWPSPVKHIPEVRPVIKAVEAKLMDAICEAFGLDPISADEERIIKRADRIAQKIEAHAFMDSRGRGWPDMPEVSLEKLQQFKEPMASIDAYKAFKEKFEFLHSCIK